MSELSRYLLAQAIGWVIVAAVVAILVAGFDLSAWLWLALAFAVLKDLLLLPAMRRSWGPPTVGPASLVGARGVAVEPIAPVGHVRVRGELWQAEARDPSAAIPRGATVVVREVRRLVLVVDLAAGPDGPAAGLQE